MKHTRIALIVVATVVGALPLSEPAWSCSCSRVSVEELFEAADAVYEGKVLDVDMGYLRLAWCSVKHLFGLGLSDLEVELNCGVRMTLEVTRRWKGQEAGVVQVMTGRGGGDCGVPLDEGTEYLLYLYELAPGIYGTNSCMRPRLASDCAEDRAGLESLIEGEGR